MLDEYTSYLGRQADDIITEDTGWVSLAKELNVDRYRHRDKHPEWHTGTRFRPMFLAYLWSFVEGIPLTSIPDRLDGKSELARAFGFEPDDLPSSSTFKPVRLNERFDKLSATVDRGAEELRDIAYERGAPIGVQFNNERNSGESDLSERQIQRYLRRDGKRVLEELKSVAIPSMDLPRPDKTIYDKDELLVLAAIAAVKNEAANGAGQSLGDIKNPDPDPLLDPIDADGPSGETLLDAVKQMSVDEIADVMNFALRKIYTRAKPRLQELENESNSRFGVRANVAIDITYVAYYGEEEGMKWLQGAPQDKEYRTCHKFATITIVGENTHYILGVSPLGSEEYADNDLYPGKPQTYFHGNVVRRLLNIANRYANIRTVFADRAFHAADVIQVLEQNDLKYVIPAKKDDRIARLCDRFHNLKRGYDEWTRKGRERDSELYVVEDYSLFGRVKHSVSNTQVKTNVVLLPPDEDDETHKNGSPQPFLTNLSVSDTIRLDRVRTRERIEEYNQRGGIERSYSSIKESAAWTTSKVFEVRWWHFAFACVVYNLWLLVDFITQERLGMIETRKKPRIRLSRFLGWLEKVLDTLI